MMIWWRPKCDFDALANRRVDDARRPGDADQFKKEMATEERRKAARNEEALMLNANTSARQSPKNGKNYYQQWAEEIKAREGGTPSPVTYDTSSPSTSGAPAKQKKKLTWAEFQERPPREVPNQAHTREEAQAQEQLRTAQEELEFRQREVDRLKHEQAELAQEQERLRAGQEQLDHLQAEQKRLHKERQQWERLEQQQRKECQHHKREQERLHKEEERQEREHQEKERQAAARSQMPFGCHTPV